MAMPEPTNLYLTLTCGDPDYFFNLQVSNVTLQIVDNNTGNILSGQTNNVIVGQQMNLTCQLSVTNAGLNNAMLSNFHWTVPGDAISNFVFSDSSDIVYSNFPTADSTVVYYWVDGATNWVNGTANQIVQVSATIDGVNLTNQAIFSVLRPLAKISAITSTVNVNSPYFPGHPLLGFEDGLNDGIVFNNTMTIPPGFSGSNLWLQVVYSNDARQLQDTNLQWHSWVKNGLPPYGDTVPYGYFDSPGTPADSPNLKLPPGSKYMQGYATNTFEMWMMFQPISSTYNVPVTNSIPVPLRAVNWSWGGLATNAVGGWSLVYGTNSVNPSDFDAVTNPLWNSSIKNAQWEPSL